MSFLTPIALGLLALLPVIVIFYMLKLKRRPQRVPSTLLWRRAVQDMVANAPFQRLRNNLLMWLQLLALLLLVLALARPMAMLGSNKGETIVVLLDLSASMQTVEADGQTRLQKAKDLAMKAIDNMSGGAGLLSSFSARDEMMIIGFADKTFPLQTLTTDRGALRNAVASARALDTETNIEDAGYILQERTMVKTGDSLEPNPNARVLLISDGGLGGSALGLADVPSIEFVLVGETSDNVGITRVDLRESFSGEYQQEIFVSLLNSAGEERLAYVELEVGGTVLDLKRAELPANGAGSVLFTVGEGTNGAGTVRLSSHKDAFALDDTMPVVIQPRSELKIQLVSKGNPFLERVLAVDPRTSLEVARPDGWTPGDGYEIVIYDSFSPKTSIGAGNHVFINALPPTGAGFDPTGEPISSPRVVDWSRVHPITRFCSFDDLAVARTLPFTAPRDATPLVESSETPLIAVQETDTRRILVIGFDVLKSYWPLDVSFPIFWGNLLENWSRQGRGLGRGVWKTGTTIPLVPPRDAAKAEVSTPDGEKISFALENQGTLYLTQTTEAGLYSADFGGVQQPLAVGLMSELESRITPVESLDLGGRVLKSEKAAVAGRREIWPWLALAGLMVLLVEWLIYCRRTFM